MKWLIGLLLLSSLGRAFAQDVTWGAYVDTYYGYDFSTPPGDRAYTTQALRHDEFAVNLAYVEAKLTSEKVRGRLALQTGTSVYANYSGEKPAALADLTRLLQEAYGGYRLAPDLWIDIGLFFSHLGAESFISKENWTYTRSLGADYSPYYQSGARLTYQATPKWSFQIHILNGWQNQIETNREKALGLQVVYSPAGSTSFTFNSFLGRESELRSFNQVIAKTKLSPAWDAALSLDYGWETNGWWAVTYLNRFQLGPELALGGRLEYFRDAEQAIVKTGTGRGFQTGGASLNLDWQPDPRWILRNEVRALWSLDAIYPGPSGPRGNNVLAVTSLSLSL